MRSLLIILSVVVAIGAVGGIYVWMQPAKKPMAVRPTTTESVAIPPPPVTPTAPGTQPIVGPGAGVWVKVFDEKVPGKIAWQSRFGEYQPRPDGSVDVNNPEAEFFLDDGTLVAIVAKTGRVVIPGEASRDPSFRGSNVPPSRGELKDVTLTLYSDDTKQTTLLKCEMDNLAFDNDTLRIATEAIRQPDGTITPGDQVPVKVRGVQYDFDGRGLTIRWNGRDRRLQSLEIAHGQSLTWKPATQPAKPVAVAAAAPAPTTRRARAGAAPATPPPATNPAIQLTYRATFDSDVVVLEGTEQVAVTDILRFEMRPPEDEKLNTTPAPATRPTAVASAGTARRPARGPLAPTTRPLDKPIVINWTGKLTVAPITDGSSKLEPGQSAVELMSRGSAPVKVSYLGDTFTAATLSYSGVDDSIIARGSQQVPQVTMSRTDGTEIVTKSLHYNGTAGKVTLDGPSTAKLMMKGDKPDVQQALTAQWQELCVLTVASAGKDDLSIQDADIRGQVRIEHPDIQEFRAQQVTAAFAPLPAGQGKGAQFKGLRATGAVRAKMLPSADKPMEISAESLQVSTQALADGTLVPHRIVADGQVHGFDSEQDIRAAQVAVTLKPATRPSDFELIVASGDVSFKQTPRGRSETNGSATRLEITPQSSGDYDVTMTGAPATVTGGGSTLTGRLIKVSTKQQHAHVSGAGTLRRTQTAADTGGSPFNFDLEWGTGLVLDGIANTAEVDGGVHITGSTPDRGQVDARAEKLLIVLADPPSTQPLQPAPPATGLDLLEKKEYRSFTLDGDTRTQIVFADPKAQGPRKVLLLAPQVRIEPRGKEAIDRVIIPSAGKMLYEDLRPPTTRPSSAGLADMGDLSGPTAFEWSRQLTFDQATQSAKMVGDVNIVHETDKGEPFRLQTERLTAYFSADATATTSASDPQLQRLVADEGVQFLSKRISFLAWEMDFDPSRDLLEAKGADGSPVQIFDSSGVSTLSVKQASWSTTTQELEVRELLGQFRR